MALVKFGGGIIDMRGSIAGNTYARNTYGSYARARTMPVNPNTSRQQSVRNHMAQLTSRWANTVTSAQRDAWQAYANAVSWQNRLGETIQLTGFNHYIRSNLAILAAGLSIVDDGPSQMVLPDAPSDFGASADSVSEEMSITFDDAEAWANETDGALAVYMGTPVSPTVNFFAGPYRFLGTVLGDDAAPPPSPYTVSPLPWSISAGQVSYIRGRVIRADGRVSQIVQTKVNIIT